MDIVDRILETATKNKGISSLKALEEELNFGNGTIGKWREKSPSCKKVKELADFLSTSIDYLVSGVQNSITDPNIKELIDNYNKASIINKGRILERAATLAEQENSEMAYSVSKCTSLLDYEVARDFIELPLYDIPVSAGTGSFLDETEAEYVKIPKTDSAENADYMVRVSGDSMEPRFEDGDVVLVEKTEQVQIGDIGVFVINSEAYIKQYGNGRLISLNPRYKPINITENDTANCIGKVIAVLEVSKRV